MKLNQSSWYFYHINLDTQNHNNSIIQISSNFYFKLSYKMSTNTKITQIEESTQVIYAKVNHDLKLLLGRDPKIAREDSCKEILNILQKLRGILETINKLEVQERAKAYHLTYNAITYILDISQLMKKSNYSFEATRYLLDCIGAMQGNLILQDAKYLDRRVRIYLNISHIYQENQYYHSALGLLESGIQKIKELKALHELDPPVPQYVSKILNDNLKILKIMLIKYMIQSGSLSSNDWKKKVDEQFGNQSAPKLICLIQCLRTETRKKSNIFNKKYASNKAFKDNLLQIGYDLVKPQMDILSKALLQQKEKIQKEVQFRANENRTQQIINQQIKRKRQSENAYIKEKDYKKASIQFPFQYHVELIYYCMETKNNKFINELVDSALLRVECRRIEVPYINDIAIIASANPDPNIPNGYEKINLDLNQANLKNQLRKLRTSGKKNQQQLGKQDPKKKDAKKITKEPSPKDSQAPTQWQLQQIKHKYVFMIVKKSMSPEQAIFDMKIVLGDQETGPVGYPDTRRIIVPYIQQNMKSLQSQVKQYPGVQETTHQVPYIILYHSMNNLEDQKQKRSLIVDVKPLVGKNPMVPPEWEYNKIPFDLRQVPKEFIKHSGHDYVFLTYQTDELFNINARHIEILHNLSELQKTYPKDKVLSTQDERQIELQIIYDLEKLQKLFASIQSSLQGPLGEDYYAAKSDFLTNLCFYIWTKYLRSPLLQFDYVLEQRLNQEVIDYDYKFYRQIIERAKPIFLKGLQVFNIILINNPQADILLTSRINLQQAKYLQQRQQYKLAAESIKQCLYKIWQFRDKYLLKGVNGCYDKLLPFSITCSSILIDDTLRKMKSKYKEQRSILNQIVRMKQREKNKQTQLNKQQLAQQDFQYKKYQKADDIDMSSDKVEGQHTQLLNVVSTLQLDLANLYFRVSLKFASQVKRTDTDNANTITGGIKNTLLTGLALSLVEKLNLLNKPNQITQKNNLNELKSTLVNAGKLPSPKPSLHRLQTKLLKQFQKNPYLLSLLLMNLAAMNSQSQQKRYFLQYSLKSIRQAIKIEKQMSQDAIKNSIFIFSTLWDQELKQQNPASILNPFAKLYDGTWPAEADVPPQPILISRNSTTVTMKFAPFKPKKLEKMKEEQIKYMSLYGKISANGVDVSTNCDELQGTGIKREVSKVVKVTGLQPNNLYCFAAAGTNQNEQLKQIGKTSTDIGTFHPLPIPMLAAYLSKISYQINEYQTAEEAAKILVEQYCVKENYLTEDQRVNNLYLYTFNQKSLKSVPLTQLRSVAQAFYILALCERKKLQRMRQKNRNTPILLQEKQKQIVNLIMLSGLLTPVMTAPLNSLPFLVPDSEILIKSFLFSLIPMKWMNPKLRELGVRVMQKAMKWGLQKNQIDLARRITYRWGQRKWIMLGKIIQTQQKKEVKKGAKDPKQQQVKLVDKYCRFLLQKSPETFEYFQDQIALINQQYSDFASIFIEKAKEQVATLSQFVDNSQQEIQSINNALNVKTEMIQYLKTPLQSIGKIPQTSTYYLQYNCKLFKRAIEISPFSQQKNLVTKAQEINLASKTPQLLLAEDIYKLIMQAIQNDISWSPSSKNQLANLQEKTGQDLSKPIKIFETYEEKKKQLIRKIGEMYSLLNKGKDFDYLNMWNSQLYFLKAVVLISSNTGSFKVTTSVPGRYDKIKAMHLDDLLKKNQEMAIYDKANYTYPEQQINKLIKILNYLCQSAYSSYCIENWIKLQNVLKLTVNFITAQIITPFYHKDSQIWIYLTFLSLLSIFMLQNIRKNGFETFKKRYTKKILSTEIAGIAEKLQLPFKPQQPMVPQYMPQYFLPQLDQNTTKVYWFQAYKAIDIQCLSALISYTTQCLRIELKYNLVINIVRDFCNVTQHYFSLELLPFMIQSQGKLLQQVKGAISKQQKALLEAEQQYQKQRLSKKKGQRQAQLTGQKPKYQVQFDQKKQKITDSLTLLGQQKQFILSQANASNNIIDQIRRDTSKAVLNQSKQRRSVLQFAYAQQHMFKQFGDKGHLSRNFAKNIINNYNEIYESLKNNKTMKQTLAEIQNRNQVGNLYFAAGNIEKAKQHWNDALSTIFQQVDPINKIQIIVKQKQPYLVNILGMKQTLLGMSLLYKISRFGQYAQLNIQRKAIQLALIMSKAIFQTDIIHPQNLIGFAKYRIRKLSNSDPFADQITISLSELLVALQFFSLKAIDENWALQALPLITLFDYIATQIVKKPQISIKAKLLKVIALAQAKLISQSIILITKVANQKDLPQLWLQKSEVTKRQKGQNWYPETLGFLNSKNWNQNENKQPIQNLKKLTLSAQFNKSYGLINPLIFKYAKALILAKIYEAQFTDNYDINEIRLQNLLEAENNMRQCLKRLSVNEQAYQLLKVYHRKQAEFKKNEINQDLKKQVQSNKVKIIDFLKGNAVQQQLHKIYLAEQFSSIKRAQLVEFICRIRYTLHKINESKNMFSNCFYILKNALINLNRYSIGARNIQQGIQPQVKPKQAAQPAAGKKEDKKGNKKPADEPQQIKTVELTQQQEKQLKQEAELKKYRESSNIYWHLKFGFEMGKIMFKQNRFKGSIKLLDSVVEQCKKYKEQYFLWFSKGLIQRSFVRLGKFNLKQYALVIKKIQTLGFLERQYTNLVMDLSELVEGQNKISYLQKGLTSALNIWNANGRNAILAGIGKQNPKRTYLANNELTPQQIQQIKRKAKKADPKGGKQDKKAAKKEDPKKKKDQSKAQYKVQPLCKYEWRNLLQEDKNVLTDASMPHPNYRPANIYESSALLYIKCYIQWLSQAIINSQINQQKQKDMLSKLLHVTEQYSLSSYFLKINLYYLLGMLYKRCFSNNLQQLISRIDKGKIIIPYQDNPLNRQLVKIPEFSRFLSTNLQNLRKAIQFFKKIPDITKNANLFVQAKLSLSEVIWELADTFCLSAQYIGMLSPKYFPQKSVIDKNALQLQRMNYIVEANFYLDLAHKVCLAQNQLLSNYMTVASKNFQPTVKIDEDIMTQIMEIDQQYKAEYPQFLSQYHKPKLNVSCFDVATYMIKIYREAQCMTFTNGHLNNLLLKCHRILYNNNPVYKQKCSITSVDPTIRKDLNGVFVENQSITFVGKKIGNSERFLYLIGPLSDDNPLQQIIYGRATLKTQNLSVYSTQLYSIRSKLVISDKKNENTKKRDYIWHQKDYEKALLKLAVGFDPSIEQIPREKQPQLNQENISILIEMIETPGLIGKSRQINSFIRYLHGLKYKIENEKKSLQALEVSE